MTCAARTIWTRLRRAVKTSNKPRSSSNEGQRHDPKCVASFSGYEEPVIHKYTVLDAPQRIKLVVQRIAGDRSTLATHTVPEEA